MDIKAMIAETRKHMAEEAQSQRDRDYLDPATQNIQKKWTDLPESIYDEVKAWAGKSYDSAVNMADKFSAYQNQPQGDTSSVNVGWGDTEINIPQSEGQKKAADELGQAGREFTKQAIVPPVFLGAVIPNPLSPVFGLAAGAIMVNDLSEQIPQQIAQARKEQKDGDLIPAEVKGTGKTASAFLGIDSAAKALSDPRGFEQQFLREPIATAGEYLPAWLLGKAVYKGGKAVIGKGAKSGEVSGRQSETAKPANESQNLKTDADVTINDTTTGTARMRTEAEAGKPVESWKVPETPYVNAQPAAVLPSDKPTEAVKPVAAVRPPINEMQEYFDLVAQADNVPVRTVLEQHINKWSEVVRAQVAELRSKERKGDSGVFYNDMTGKYEKVIKNTNDHPLVQEFVTREGRYPRVDEWQKVAENILLRDDSPLRDIWQNAKDAKEYLDTLPVDIASKRKGKKTVEQQLSDKVNASTPEAKVQIGTTTQEVNVPIPGSTPKVKFSDPAIEARYQQATKGVQAEGIVSKVKGYFEDACHKATRQFEHLPNGAEFAPLKFDLSTLQHSKSVSADRAGRILQGITIDMKGDKGAYDIFQRKVLLDDLAQTEGVLPFGFTKDIVMAEKAHIDALATGHSAVSNAIAQRNAVWGEIKNSYIKAMGDIGFNVADRFGREDYFRHQILEYANGQAIKGNGSKLKTPSNAGYLKKRKGSEMDINANYLQAEFEVMAQMMHDIKTAETIAKIDRNYSIKDKLVKEFGKEWKQNIPDGYEVWQPREGSSFYMAHSIPEKLASKLLDGSLEELGLTADQIKTVKAKGSPFKEFVVKNEVAQTLDAITTTPKESTLFKGVRAVTTPWKQWVLSSPTRIIKYNTRNMVGDIDAVVAMNPRALRQSKRAAGELYQTIYGDRSLTPTMEAWRDRGGMETTLNIQELGEINRLKMFKDFGAVDNPNIVSKAWDGYWKGANQFNTYREAILRYANFIEFKQQMENNGGTPKTFGASKPAEIMALRDINDRAFKLSNEVMGAYDSVSVLGKDLRATLLPFWSWNETNFTRYSQFLRNQIGEGNYAAVGGNVAKKVGVTAVKGAYGVGKFAVKASVLWAGLQAFNLSVFPEEEAELSKDEQARPHIILGRADNGDIRYFNRLGSVGDFLEWFGLDSPTKDVQDFLNGTRNPAEIALDMLKSPVNKLAQAVTPLIKIPGEVATGTQTYPNVFEKRAIKDKGTYAATAAGLTNEFKAVSRSPVGEVMGMMPRPGQPYTIPNLISNLTVYKEEPNRAAYYGTLENVRKFREKQGQSGGGDFNSPRTEIMRNYKAALKYGDMETAAKLKDMFEKADGTNRGFKQSMASMHPLAGIKKSNHGKFEDSLTPQQKKELEKAIKYYESVLSKH